MGEAGQMRGVVVPLLLVCWQLAWLSAGEEVTLLAGAEEHAAVALVSRARTQVLSTAGSFSRRAANGSAVPSAAGNSSVNLSKKRLRDMNAKLQQAVAVKQGNQVKTKSDMLANAANNKAAQQTKLNAAQAAEAQSLKKKEKQDEKSALGKPLLGKLGKLPTPSKKSSESVRAAAVQVQRMRTQAVNELKAALSGVQTAMRRVTLTGKEVDLENYLKRKADATQAHHQIALMRDFIHKADKLKARQVDKTLAATEKDKKDPNIRVRLDVWKQDAAKQKHSYKALQTQSKKSKNEAVASDVRKQARNKEIVLAEANKEVALLDSQVKQLDVTEAKKQNATDFMKLSHAQQDYETLKLQEKKAVSLQTQAEAALKKAELHKVAKKKQIILLGKVEVKDKKKAASAADQVAHELKKVDQADVKTAGARHNLDVGKQADKKIEEMKTSKLTTTMQNLDTAIDRAERKLSSLKNTQTEPAPNFDTKTASPEEMLKEKEKKVASATEQLVDEQKKETENLDSKIKAMKKVSRAGDQAESQVKADLAKGKRAQLATNVKQLKSAIKAVKKTTAEKMALQISKMSEVSDKSAQDQVEQAKATFQTKKDAVKKTAAQSGKGAATSIQETMINLEKQHQANILSIRGKMKERLSEKVRALKREMLSKEKLRIKKVEDVAGQGDKKKLTKGAESAKVATRTKLNKAKAQIQKWEVNVLAERRKAIVTRVQTTIKKLEESKRLTEDPQMKGVLKSQIQQVEDGGGKKIKKMKSKLRIETRQKIADTQATLLTRAAQESRAP